MDLRSMSRKMRRRARTLSGRGVHSRFRSRELEGIMRSRVFLFLLPLLLAFSAPAFARGGGTLDSILPEIRAQHPGRLSDAEPFTADDGSTHYRIKWMTPEGRILYFDADARSGR